MAKKERFGKFVLLEELDSSGLGTDYRAAKLGPAGALERIVLLLRLPPALSGLGSFTSALLEQTKTASTLHGPNLLKLIAIGRVESTYYIAYEFVEGRSLKAALERSRRDGFPFTPDHALAIASKVCATLEYAHGRKDAHGPHVHGLLTPDAVLITYEGEIKLRGFGVAAAGALKSGVVTTEDRRYLAPEQLAGADIGARADIHAAGALLFEMLTGQPPSDTARVATARLASTGESEPLPPPLAEILSRSLGGASPYREIAEMRQAVDALLYSGRYNSTAFNVAFFMHSLFREEIDRDARTVAEERAASYAEYAVEEPPRPAVPAQPPAPPPPVAPSAPIPASTEPAPPPVQQPSPPRAEPPAPKPREPVPAFGIEAAPPVTSVPRPASPVAAPARPAPRGRSSAPAGVIAAGALLVALVAAAGWYLLAGPGSRPVVPPPTTLSAEMLAAQARVRELEGKLQRFEQEKADAEAKAAEEAKQKVEAQAAAKGQAVDPAALKRAQDAARLRSQQESDRKQQEERQRLEAEQRATEARLLEERRRAAEAAAAAAAAAPAPTTLAAAPPTTLPPATPPPTTAPPAPVAPVPAAVKPGSLVNVNDLGVIPPVLTGSVPLVYPELALRQRVTGNVELSVLIDEKGSVLEARVVKGANGIGLNQAAIDNVKRRRYRPATKDGVPVKVNLPVIVKFELPR